MVMRRVDVRRTARIIFPLANDIQQCLDHIRDDDSTEDLSDPASEHSEGEKDNNEQLDDENELIDEEDPDTDSHILYNPKNCSKVAVVILKHHLTSV